MQWSLIRRHVQPSDKATKFNMTSVSNVHLRMSYIILIYSNKMPNISYTTRIFPFELCHLSNIDGRETAHANRLVVRLGPYFNIKIVFTGRGIPMLKIRRSWDHHIFIMGIPILIGRQIYIETAPWKGIFDVFPNKISKGVLSNLLLSRCLSVKM